MAIITCPECGQNPVSDRAVNCPRCGCPIAASDAAVDPVLPSPGSADQASTNRKEQVRQERRAQIDPFGAIVGYSSEFPDTNVTVKDLTQLADLVTHIQDWCEEFELMRLTGPTFGVEHVQEIRRLPNLKSLKIDDASLDDYGLLQLSNLQKMRRLRIDSNAARATESGWLQLARLSGLEYLRILKSSLDQRHLSREERNRIRAELGSRLPQAIIE